MDIWDLAIITLICLNLFVGVGSYFSTELLNSFGYNSTASELPYFSINETAYNESTEQIELNPTLSNIQSGLSLVKNVFFGIPAITDDIMTQANAPETLRERIVTALYVIVFALYIIGIIKLIFNAN